MQKCFISMSIFCLFKFFSLVCLSVFIKYAFLIVCISSVFLFVFKSVVSLSLGLSLFYLSVCFFLPFCSSASHFNCLSVGHFVGLFVPVCCVASVCLSAFFVYYFRLCQSVIFKYNFSLFSIILAL